MLMRISNIFLKFINERSAEEKAAEVINQVYIKCLWVSEVFFFLKKTKIKWYIKYKLNVIEYLKMNR